MKHAFSREAANDLREIGRFIARDNPQRAISFAEELRDRCRSLTAFPQSHPVEPIDGHRDLRRCSHGRYAIFYRIDRDHILIVAILHSARDTASVLTARRD